MRGALVPCDTRSPSPSASRGAVCLAAGRSIAAFTRDEGEGVGGARRQCKASDCMPRQAGGGRLHGARPPSVHVHDGVVLVAPHGREVLSTLPWTLCFPAVAAAVALLPDILLEEPAEAHAEGVR